MHRDLYPVSLSGATYDPFLRGGGRPKSILQSDNAILFDLQMALRHTKFSTRSISRHAASGGREKNSYRQNLGISSRSPSRIKLGSVHEGNAIVALRRTVEFVQCRRPR